MVLLSQVPSDLLAGLQPYPEMPSGARRVKESLRVSKKGGIHKKPDRSTRVLEKDRNHKTRR
jgi:hypothetical protein